MIYKHKIKKEEKNYLYNQRICKRINNKMISLGKKAIKRFN